MVATWVCRNKVVGVATGVEVAVNIEGGSNVGGAAGSPTRLQAVNPPHSIATIRMNLYLAMRFLLIQEPKDSKNSLYYLNYWCKGILTELSFPLA